MSEPLITKNDRLSAVWQKLQPHLEDRLAQLRAKNDKVLPQQQTDFLRGRIEEVKHLLSLGTDQPTTPLQDAGFED